MPRISDAVIRPSARPSPSTSAPPVNAPCGDCAMRITRSSCDVRPVRSGPPTTATLVTDRHHAAAPGAADCDGKVTGRRFVSRRQRLDAKARHAYDGKAHRQGVPEHRAVERSAVVEANDRGLVAQCTGRRGDQVGCEHDAGGRPAVALHLHNGRRGAIHGGRKLARKIGKDAHGPTVERRPGACDQPNDQGNGGARPRRDASAAGSPGRTGPRHALCAWWGGEAGQDQHCHCGAEPPSHMLDGRGGAPLELKGMSHSVAGLEPLSLKEAAALTAALQRELGRVIIGQQSVIAEILTGISRRRPLPAARRAGAGQDAADQDAGRRGAPQVQPDPVHART